MNVSPKRNQELQAILQYITASWSVLSRSTAACEALVSETFERVRPLESKILHHFQALHDFLEPVE